MKARLFALVAIAGMFASAPAPAGDDLRYKLLRIDGQTVRWHGGAGAEITYAFLTEGRMVGERNCRPTLPVGPILKTSGLRLGILRAAAASAFARWSEVADIRFVERATPPADIVIGAGLDRGVAFADVSTAHGKGQHGALTQALICLNPRETWTINHDGDEETRDLAYVLTHEIGHAIGLDHPGRSGALMAFKYNENADTLEPGDIHAARLLYGMPVTTEPGVPLR